MIRSDALRLSGITHGFFTREGGHSTGIFTSLNCGLGSGDDQDTVRRNRAVVAGHIGIDEPKLITAYQVHSPDVVVVERPWDGPQRPRADAMVTLTRGVGLGVLTADCAPVLFADPDAGVIGAAHAGWKGALAGVTTATLAAMERLGAKRHNIVAAIGPMISQSAYEVGPEFPDRFIEQDGANRNFFVPSPRAGHSLFDLPGYIEARLRRDGAGHVVNLGLCTFRDESRFFSYRRTTHRAEKSYGRQISAIALV